MKLKKRTKAEVLAWAERKGYRVERAHTGLITVRGPTGKGIWFMPRAGLASLNEGVARLPNLTGARA